MSQMLTEEDVSEINSVYANEPFDYAAEQGFLKRFTDKDPELEFLVGKYLKASARLKSYLRALGVWEGVR